jgi:demethylmenaquinone methyltransferase/2-methoxy-6-polyprenyl-1,4-benzoquinol methylase
MDKKDVIQFFDRMAPQWDADMIRNDNIIDKIFDGADIRSGVDVLDVACGTGVLFPDYLARKVGSITAVDISPEMVKIAAGKFPEENITVLCADVEELAASKQFDRIMVYNAFPHFPDPETLIATLSGMLCPGGTLTVAHGMSRQQIDHRHEGAASKVSIGLMHEDALAEIFSRHLTVTVKISDQDMYQVTGRKNQGL